MLKLETKKLELGFYPYTYVRASVMKSLLFKKDDYQRMLKMGFSEIAKFLQESHYKNEINQLATEYSGSDLLELALNRNLADSFKKLISISHPNLRVLINEYIKRKDIEIAHIYCSSRDAKFIKEFDVQSADIIGGLIAENNERTVRVDYSFETLLQSIKENELQSIRKLLF